MRQGIWRQAPALAVSALALFVALGGTVYAAKKIDGRAVRAKSLPGNRVKPKSLPGNRLKVKSVPGNRLRPRSVGAGRLRPGVLQGAVRSTLALVPLTGTDINELTLGQVPSAAHAETAGSAQSAVDAETALNAVHAITADKVNGYSAGCLPGTTLFAGACWQSSPSEIEDTAPGAAADCAQQGGTLPEALQLAAFAQEPGVNLHAEDEWSGDLTTFSGPDAYAVVTVSAAAVLNVALSTDARHYRCVIPLVS